MGISVQHALGRERKFFTKVESTAGTWIKPVATDACRVISSTLQRQKDLILRNDHRPTRSYLESIDNASKATWEVEKYIIPSGTAGTPPDDHPLWLALAGTYANTPATQDYYSFSSSQTPTTLTILDQYGTMLQRCIWGAWVNKATITLSGSEPAKVKFEGEGMGYARTGRGTLNGALSAQSTFAPDDTGADVHEEKNFMVNSLIAFDDDDNSSAGFQVTAVDYDTPSHTIEANATAADANNIFPFAPTETVAGSPIAGILGSLTVDSIAIPITGMEVTIDHQNTATDGEAFREYPNDVILGDRLVTGKLDFRARADLIRFLGARDQLTQAILDVTCGNVAGKRFTMALNTIEFLFGSIDVPEGGEGTISLPFRALGNTGEDEVDFTFN